MNTFTIIFSLILFGLSFLCFWLPYKNGRKTIGLTAGLIFGFLVTFSLIANIDFFVVFIWLFVIAFQIIFISYWAFRLRDKPKWGTISVVILTTTFLLIVMQPWISDWTFSKKDARELLLYHGLELKDEIKILENESGGLRDFYHSFTLKISDADYERIVKRIKASKNYVGLFTDLTQTPTADYKTYDTLDYETDYHFNREYFSKQQMDDGTYHFRFQLSKTDKELNYIGSDE
jgi:hypothetical protein